MSLNDKTKILSELHRIYEAGNLRILAGAGVSIASGFPDWETMNSRLLRNYLSESLRSLGVHQIDPGSSLEEALTKEVYERLGRDAVAELILRSAGSAADFHDRLASALYQGRGLENLYLSDLQRQIAGLTISPKHLIAAGSFAGKGAGQGVAKIYTTNYDPLLEMAIARAYVEANLANIDPNPAVSFRIFRLPLGASDEQQSPDLPKVRHLHGWVEPDGGAGGQVVYAESHYMALQRAGNADANIQTEDLFSKSGATLIIGMSLTDPNLRRLLYSRSSHPLTNSATSIYYFMRQGDRGLAPVYAAKFWELLKVRLIPYSEYSELPDLIRQIQWGESIGNGVPRWFLTSAALSGIKLYSTLWRQLAESVLTALHSQIVRMYLTEPREGVRVTFFAPAILASGGLPDHRIYELGSVDFSGKFEASSTDQLIQDANARNLDIHCDRVQGLAGLAFVVGSMRMVDANNSADLDFNFTAETQLAFDRGSYRDWRSMLAVTIIGGPLQIPLGVLCIHSNFGRPFWKSLEQNSVAFSDFNQTVLKAGRLLLVPKP